MKIQENYSLKNLNTFGVEVSAKYFAEVKDLGDLKYAIEFAKINHLEILFLGGGSNVLFTKSFGGLVIKLDLKGISEAFLNEDEVLVTAKAGENWHEFVQLCLDKNYGGLENLSLIPGNVGTSPMQNIGAYGTEIKDTFVNCKVLNLGSMQVEEFNNEECRFGYRESVFKREGKGKYVILDVTFKLSTENHQLKTEYGAIKTELEKFGIENPTIQDVSRAVISIRQSKLPDPKVTGNAGSFFKNPTVSANQFSKVQKQYPQIPNYPNGEMVKIPAGWLIEQCGWKGKQIGNVASHELQALVIVNKTGAATGKEIYDFSTLIIESVIEKFGIELEREVNII
ncbi:UDP-N-acetylmuramate dehydrogenase [Chryseobacterium sp. HSC-36S06]|uniref:UDP-N-acetylmuramate dehydrogenase n=1 Tax=Chryseobacterium sp. HSC-36S06 TaxID=2910970 RepID=UPI0020A20B73|nr:UDP-N-acetylmuramate dehydrogenase [Chryseobacterium sp. HSC-36S06]MCP2039000.1 UDP-N-acetylmuramate dehydrogenase [Chryseobacterium sp. HSC-36S06]